MDVYQWGCNFIYTYFPIWNFLSILILYVNDFILFCASNKCYFKSYNIALWVWRKVFTASALKSLEKYNTWKGET